MSTQAPATDVNIDNLMSTAAHFLAAADRSACGTSTLDVIRNLHKAERNLEATKRATVERARENGSTWAEIADALGITRQAAQQKYGAKR